ncbi:unnamed protein product [Ambrosiozyma monospora]|uniref:Unnamed protein product n=1 Tax=Ambrosiozyma monospora TaxID=43982 RepID=A0ACB5T4R2_AMBMO|nr:unnamed protein product [Ambrosiozyma monospora]
MSASLRGTMDVKLTKVLSVHVVALLPPGSTNLNVQLPVQTAGLVGIGLLYLGTQHRKMTEVVLSQISSTLILNEKPVVNEGYRLAAGIALGYINLGKGDNLKNMNATHILDSLYSMATSLRDIQSAIEYDKSVAGALIALMFMFMKTNDAEASAKLNIPTTPQLLEYSRPDFWMLRALAKNMISWDYICPTDEWINSQLPTPVEHLIPDGQPLNSDYLANYNILGGLLLSIGIRFASTGSLRAKTLLLFYLDKFMNLCTSDPETYDQVITSIGLQNIRDIVAIALSLVMAGTGDLDTMRRLRFLQGITDNKFSYGNYMALSMALGFLFLGGGQQAFRTDDLFSIAALITSIYPVFGSNNYSLGNTCVEIHLQALRHFWALGVQNRCLLFRDVNTKQPVKVAFTAALNTGEILQMTSPCLLPDLKLINRINTTDDKYYPLELNNSELNDESFAKSLTLYVYRKETIDSSKSLTLTETLKSNDNIDFKLLEFKSELERIVKNSKDTTVDQLWNLHLVFNYTDYYTTRGKRKNRSGSAMSEETAVSSWDIINSSSVVGNSVDDDMVDDLNFLGVKFIERLKNELFTNVEEKFL